eukprot:1448027-Prymnesium_polylepis.1
MPRAVRPAVCPPLHLRRRGRQRRAQHAMCSVRAHAWHARRVCARCQAHTLCAMVTRHGTSSRAMCTRDARAIRTCAICTRAICTRAICSRAKCSRAICTRVICTRAICTRAIANAPYAQAPPLASHMHTRQMHTRQMQTRHKHTRHHSALALCAWQAAHAPASLAPPEGRRRLRDGGGAEAAGPSPSGADRSASERTRRRVSGRSGSGAPSRKGKWVLPLAAARAACLWSSAGAGTAH